MKKLAKLSILSFTFALVGCSNVNENVITVCASEVPHAEILNEAVKPLLKEKGYELKVTILDWTLQNDGVYNNDYDANYFEHRPYLQQYDSNSSTYIANYEYKKVFPLATVHFEPLRIYEGKKSASEFETCKKSATYEICNDVSNEIRALDLLVQSGVISSYELDSNGNPINLPSNITLVSESLLVSSLNDYDYAVIPTNSALTGNLKANSSLPVESNEVADLRANVLAGNVTKYKNDSVYKAKIDALTDCMLDSSVSSYIASKYQGVIVPTQKDLRP